jgi:hypothetical protein
MIKTIYLTIWFKVHPFTGPNPTLYPTWRTAYALARQFTP